MNKYLLALSVGMVAFASQADEAATNAAVNNSGTQVSSCVAHPKYANWEETQITSDIHQALNIFMQNLPAGSKLKQVTEVRALNEDGRYIAFEVELENGQYWNGVIHHNPRGDYLVSGVPHEGVLCN